MQNARQDIGARRVRSPNSPDDDKQTVISGMENVFGVLTTLEDGLSGSKGPRIILDTRLRWPEVTHDGRSSCRIAGGMRGRTTFTRRSSSCASASLTVMAISADTGWEREGAGGVEGQREAGSRVGRTWVDRGEVRVQKASL